MELAPRVLSLFPILLAAADLYAALARMAHVSEGPHLAHVSREARRWSDLAVHRTAGPKHFAVRRIASGLLLTAICNEIRRAVPPPHPRPTTQDRRWRKRAALLGSLGQRHLCAGLKLFLPAEQAALIHACGEAHSWAAAALVGARSANQVEDALRRAFRGAHVTPASSEEDALEATDFRLTWPRVRGGYLVQVKTAPLRDKDMRVLVFNNRLPHRHQFLMDPGDSVRAEELRRVGDRQYGEAFQVWSHAQTRWQRTQDPWFAAYVTVRADLPDGITDVLARLLAQSFILPVSGP